MNVFLSWSGSTSHKVAIIFRDWLPNVIQSIKPYVSSEDIDKGARWSTDIAKELENASYGIICLTKENISSPWINFEAGALSKAVDKTRVTPFLLNLKRSEVQGPMLQFQSTILEKDDMRKLMLSINAAFENSPLDESRLTESFNIWWPYLEKKLKEIPMTSFSESNKSSEIIPSQDPPVILEEILDLVRNQQKMLSDILGIDIGNKLALLFSKIVPPPELIRNVQMTLPLKDKVFEIERDLVINELKKNDYNMSKTAQALGISRPTLYDKTKSLNIEILKTAEIAD
jgi:hypothetical protein